MYQGNALGANQSILHQSSLSNQDFIVAENQIVQQLSTSKVVNRIKITVLNPDLTAPDLDPFSSVILKVTLPNVTPAPLLPMKVQQEIESENATNQSRCQARAKVKSLASRIPQESETCRASPKLRTTRASRESGMVSFDYIYLYIILNFIIHAQIKLRTFVYNLQRKTRIKRKNHYGNFYIKLINYILILIFKR